MQRRKGNGIPPEELYALLAPYDTESDPDETQRLWRRVIVQAVQDALNNIQTKSMKFRLQAEKKRSLEWLTENGKDYRIVCDFAGVHAERTRQNITSFLTNQKGARIMAKAKTAEDDNVIGYNPNSEDAKIQAFLQRVENLEREKKQIADDISAVWAEAKDMGYDTKVMKDTLKVKKMAQEVRDSYFFLLGKYTSAVGAPIQLSLFSDDA